MTTRERRDSAEERAALALGADPSPAAAQERANARARRRRRLMVWVALGVVFWFVVVPLVPFGVRAVWRHIKPAPVLIEGWTAWVEEEDTRVRMRTDNYGGQVTPEWEWVKSDSKPFPTSARFRTLAECEHFGASEEAHKDDLDSDSIKTFSIKYGCRWEKSTQALWKNYSAPQPRH